MRLALLLQLTTATEKLDKSGFNNLLTSLQLEDHEKQFVFRSIIEAVLKNEKIKLVNSLDSKINHTDINEIGKYMLREILALKFDITNMWFTKTFEYEHYCNITNDTRPEATKGFEWFGYEFDHLYYAKKMKADMAFKNQFDEIALQ